MPTYDFVCEECGKSFEVFRMRTLRDDEKVCDACGSTRVRQKISGGFFNKPTGPEPASCGSCSPAQKSSFG